MNDDDIFQRRYEDDVMLSIIHLLHSAWIECVVVFFRNIESNWIGGIVSSAFCYFSLFNLAKTI